MNEGEYNDEEKLVVTNADKAREAAKLGQEMRRRGFTRTQSGEAAAHELKHALADKGGEGLFLLRKNEKLTVPTYQSQGKRTAEQMKKIALAPGKGASPADLEIAQNADLEIKKRQNLFTRIIRSIFWKE